HDAPRKFMRSRLVALSEGSLATVAFGVGADGVSCGAASWLVCSVRFVAALDSSALPAAGSAAVNKAGRESTATTRMIWNVFIALVRTELPLLFSLRLFTALLGCFSL